MVTPMSQWTQSLPTLPVCGFRFLASGCRPWWCHQWVREDGGFRSLKLEGWRWRVWCLALTVDGGSKARGGSVRSLVDTPQWQMPCRRHAYSSTCNALLSYGSPMSPASINNGDGICRIPEESFVLCFFWAGFSTKVSSTCVISWPFSMVLRACLYSPCLEIADYIRDYFFRNTI